MLNLYQKVLLHLMISFLYSMFAAIQEITKTKNNTPIIILAISWFLSLVSILRTIKPFLIKL